MPEENTQTQSLSQDEILEQYLKKRNKTKKITVATIVAIAFALAVTMLFLTIWKIDIRPKFMLQQAPQTYEVMFGGKTNDPYAENAIEYDTITEKFKQAFSMPIFSTWLTSYNSNFVLDETSKNEFFTLNLSSLLGTSDYLKVTFRAGEQKLTITDNSGKPYDSERGGEDLQFTEYYVALPEGNETQDITVVIPAYGNFQKGEKAVAVKLVLRTNVYELRTALEEMVTKA